MDKYQFALQQALVGLEYWDKKARINQVFFETKHVNKHAGEQAARKHESLRYDIQDEAAQLVEMLDQFVQSLDE